MNSELLELAHKFTVKIKHPVQQATIVSEVSQKIKERGKKNKANTTAHITSET